MTTLNNLLNRADLPAVLPTDEAAAAINRAPSDIA
jgi:hypothetical protein